MCLHPNGSIKVYGPWLNPMIAAIWWDPWNPLDVMIDGNLAGRVSTCRTSEFSVAPGHHKVQVRWSRAHYLRSRAVTVKVEPDETVELASPAIHLVTVGIPRLRVATDKDHH